LQEPLQVLLLRSLLTQGTPALVLIVHWGALCCVGTPSLFFLCSLPLLLCYSQIPAIRAISV
jgi:hypothetical protein